MKKHLRVKDLVALLSNVENTMGDDVHCVVVIGNGEYPVIGVETYDGVFCRIVVGSNMHYGSIERRGDEVFVAE